MQVKSTYYVITKKETMETISSAKCPFLNRDSAEYNADYLAEYADYHKRKMR